MFLSIVSFFIIILISSINGQCTESQCTTQGAGSTCCFNIGYCPASSRLCCFTDLTHCCSTQYSMCCGDGQGCCLWLYPVCYPSGSYCCGKKGFRRDESAGRLIEIHDGISKLYQSEKMIYHP